MPWHTLRPGGPFLRPPPVCLRDRGPGRSHFYRAVCIHHLVQLCQLSRHGLSPGGGFYTPAFAPLLVPPAGR